MICRTVTPSAAMGIISPRDFVDVVSIKHHEDGTVSSNGMEGCVFTSSKKKKNRS